MTTASAVVVGLAGCLGADDDREEDIYGDWFTNANNFDGTVDHTDKDETTVQVGAAAGFAFDPAAIRVETGTTVVWEWTGEGGHHDVAEEDGAFESQLVDEEGHTFSHTFDETGLYRYVCNPHKNNGMVGAVQVVD